jgi:heme-degrading monooxygenase HmoA
VIVEHAVLPVTKGREEEFEATVASALPIIESAPNCFGAEVRRQEEDGSMYLLLVRWSSLAAHMAFRDTELFTQWRELTHPFYSSPPTVTHFREPLTR